MSNDYWNPNLYDQQHDFVSQFGEGILQLLAAQDGEHILDLGCGTGDIASTLSEKGVHVKKE